MITGSAYNNFGVYRTGVSGTPEYGIPGIHGNERKHPYQDRQFCDYCHRMSEQDRRGCCINCGAPRMPEGYLVY